MRKEITVIKMRTGAEYIVSKERGDALRQRLATSIGSMFFNIDDLGVTVNSADISLMEDDFELVAQKENLLGEGQMTEEDKKKRDDLIAKTRADLIKRGVLMK